MCPLRSNLRTALLAAALPLVVLGPGRAGAQPLPERQPLMLTDANFMELSDQAKSSQGHPNEVWRFRGLQAYVDHRPAEAIERFERAASYADKFSQHYLSLMHWTGTGTPVDRVQAYIWADLAAERGGRSLLLLRENMWSMLSSAQQREVLERGPGFYARYGDDVALPRANREIRRFARGMTGSRVGFSNANIDITLGGPIHGAFGGSAGLMAASQMVVGGTSEDVFYADGRTRPGAYWRAENALLDGTVNVGPVEAAPPETPPQKQE